MTERDRWERWAPLSGIVFVVLLPVLFVSRKVPAQGLNVEELASFYQDQGEGAYFLQFFVAAVAGAALLWFSGSLRAALRRVEPPPGRLSGIVFGGGVGAAVLLLVAATYFLAPFAVLFRDLSSLDPGMFRVVSGAGLIAEGFAQISAAMMVGASSLVALRFGGLPRWFAWVGFLVALALLLNPVLPAVPPVWLAWIVVAAIVLLMRPVAGTPTR